MRSANATEMKTNGVLFSNMYSLKKLFSQEAFNMYRCNMKCQTLPKVIPAASVCLTVKYRIVFSIDNYK